VLLAVLSLSLLVYAALATDVVHHGPLSEFDADVSEWVARTMPSWAEWLARPFSWVGGLVGLAIIGALVVVWLLRRGERAVAVVFVAVTAGSQLLATVAKAGYDRPRPVAGSPIALPSSSSFPSGHATTIAVFGLLGLIVARGLPARGGRTAAIAAGFGLGALIGASRVVLNVHFVTDVLAGSALGIAWLTLCLLAGMRLQRRRRR
jgi:undecaprenyl-diphosphatase